MELLRVFDEKNYDPSWRRFCREAVRAVIVSDGKLAMVHSGTKGYYKFPGGGIEAGENHLDTLIRETEEESGLEIIPSTVSEFGFAREIRKGNMGEEIFDHTSYYYFADVTGKVKSLRLDDYEEKLGYALSFIEPAAAYRANAAIMGHYRSSFLRRETFILELIMNGAAGKKDFGAPSAAGL